MFKKPKVLIFSLAGFSALTCASIAPILTSCKENTPSEHIHTPSQSELSHKNYQAGEYETIYSLTLSSSLDKKEHITITPEISTISPEAKLDVKNIIVNNKTLTFSLVLSPTINSTQKELSASFSLKFVCHNSDDSTKWEQTISNFNFTVNAVIKDTIKGQFCLLTEDVESITSGGKEISDWTVVEKEAGYPDVVKVTLKPTASTSEWYDIQGNNCTAKIESYAEDGFYIRFYWTSAQASAAVSQLGMSIDILKKESLYPSWFNVSPDSQPAQQVLSETATVTLNCFLCNSAGVQQTLPKGYFELEVRHAELTDTACVIQHIDTSGIQVDGSFKITIGFASPSGMPTPVLGETYTLADKVLVKAKGEPQEPLLLKKAISLTLVSPGQVTISGGFAQDGNFIDWSFNSDPENPTAEKIPMFWSVPLGTTWGQLLDSQKLFWYDDIQALDPIIQNSKIEEFEYARFIDSNGNEVTRETELQNGMTYTAWSKKKDKTKTTIRLRKSDFEADWDVWAYLPDSGSASGWSFKKLTDSTMVELPLNDSHKNGWKWEEIKPIRIGEKVAEHYRISLTSSKQPGTEQQYEYLDQWKDEHNVVIADQTTIKNQSYVMCFQKIIHTEFNIRLLVTNGKSSQEFVKVRDTTKWAEIAARMSYAHDPSGGDITITANKTFTTKGGVWVNKNKQVMQPEWLLSEDDYYTYTCPFDSENYAEGTFSYSEGTEIKTDKWLVSIATGPVQFQDLLIQSGQEATITNDDFYDCGWVNSQGVTMKPTDYVVQGEDYKYIARDARQADLKIVSSLSQEKTFNNVFPSASNIKIPDIQFNRNLSANELKSLSVNIDSVFYYVGEEWGQEQWAPAGDFITASLTQQQDDSTKYTMSFTNIPSYALDNLVMLGMEYRFKIEITCKDKVLFDIDDEDDFWYFNIKDLTSLTASPADTTVFNKHKTMMSENNILTHFTFGDMEQLDEATIQYLMSKDAITIEHSASKPFTGNRYDQSTVIDNLKYVAQPLYQTESGKDIYVDLSTDTIQVAFKMDNFRSSKPIATTDAFSINNVTLKYKNPWTEKSRDLVTTFSSASSTITNTQYISGQVFFKYAQVDEETEEIIYKDVLADPACAADKEIIKNIQTETLQFTNNEWNTLATLSFYNYTPDLYFLFGDSKKHIVSSNSYTYTHEIVDPDDPSKIITVEEPCYLDNILKQYDQEEKLTWDWRSLGNGKYIFNQSTSWLSKIALGSDLVFEGETYEAGTLLIDLPSRARLSLPDYQNYWVIYNLQEGF